MLIINHVISVFIIIGIGFFLNYKGIIEEKIKNFMNNLAYYLILPMMIFDSIYKVPFKESFDPHIIAGLYSVSFTVFFFGILMASKMEDGKKGAFVNSILRSNIAYIGFPIVYSLYGTHGLARLSVVTGFVAPVGIGLAVLYLNFLNKKASQKENIAAIFIKDPMIITCIIALLVSYFEIKIPVVASNTIGLLGMMGSPLMLLAVGAGLNISAIRKDRLLLALSAFIKLIIVPLLSLVVFTYLIPITEKEVLGVAVLTYCFPSALSTHVLVKKYGSDHEFSAASITVSTILSLFTISLWIYIVSAIL